MKPDTPEKLLLSARDSAAACSVSLSTWYVWLSAGRIPAPIRISGRVLWARGELLRWIEAGCPARCRWEQLRGAER